MKNGEILIGDRINLNQVREKLDAAYDEIARLDHDDVVILAGLLVVVHNHWNWEDLLYELKQKKGVENE